MTIINRFRDNPFVKRFHHDMNMDEINPLKSMDIETYWYTIRQSLSPDCLFSDINFSEVMGLEVKVFINEMTHELERSFSEGTVSGEQAIAIMKWLSNVYLIYQERRTTLVMSSDVTDVREFTIGELATTPSDICGPNNNNIQPPVINGTQAAFCGNASDCNNHYSNAVTRSSISDGLMGPTKHYL